MLSTSDSNILEIQNLHLMYNLNTHHDDSVRDKFVRAIGNPVEFAFSNKDVYHVLKGVDIKISKGERVGVLGVNGAGKTTLCRLISGMIRPDEGSVSVNGIVRPIFSTSFGIMPELTGRENADLLAHFFFPEVSDIEKKILIEEALEFSELDHFVDVPIKKYSRGMQARLFLSLVSSRPADLLILDEVFDGADHFFQQKIADRVRTIMEKSGAVLFVSHSTKEIEDNCTRVLILSQGKIEYDGPVKEGIDHYLNIKNFEK